MTKPGTMKAPSKLGPVDQPFAIDGRMSARRGNDAVAVSFAWTHSPPRDELVVTTPLGGALGGGSRGEDVGELQL